MIRLTRTWPLLKQTASIRKDYDLLGKEIEVMSKWRKADDKELTAKQDQFQAVEEAFNESFAKLRAEHKIVVGNEDDAVDLCDLVRLKYWKVKLLVHDSTLGPVKFLIWVEAQKVGLTMKQVKDNVMLEH
ncbi:unnamed protein product [Prunus armeniaca]